MPLASIFHKPILTFNEYPSVRVRIIRDYCSITDKGTGKGSAITINSRHP
jgi:hypothetical protein